jgi:hypothetical protein
MIFDIPGLVTGFLCVTLIYGHITSYFPGIIRHGLKGVSGYALMVFMIFMVSFVAVT